MRDKIDEDGLPDVSSELTPTERFARAVARRDSTPPLVAAAYVRNETPERPAAAVEDDQSNQPRSRCPVCNVVMVCVGEMAAAVMYRCERCRAGLAVPRPSHV